MRSTVRVSIFSPMLSIGCCGLFGIGCTPHPPPPAPTVGQAVENLGYIPLQRPDNNFATGTIVAVTSPKPFNGEIVCSGDQIFARITLLPGSQSVSTAWQSAVSGNLSVGATVTQKVNAQLGADTVTSIDGSFTNPKAFDLRDTDIISAGQDPQTPNCLIAIQNRLSNHESVVMIRSSVGADASYKINYSDKVSAQAQAQLTPQIAGNIAAGLQVTGTSTLSGTGLVFGVAPSTNDVLAYVNASPKPPAVAAAATAITNTLQTQARNLNLPADQNK